MCINCVIMDLIIYDSSFWLAASLLTLGLVELLNNSRGYWRVFIITAEMNTNKEATTNHWDTNCHCWQNIHHRLAPLSYSTFEREPQMLSFPKKELQNSRSRSYIQFL